MKTCLKLSHFAFSLALFCFVESAYVQFLFLVVPSVGLRTVIVPFASHTYFKCFLVLHVFFRLFKGFLLDKQACSVRT